MLKQHHIHSTTRCYFSFANHNKRSKQCHSSIHRFSAGPGSFSSHPSLLSVVHLTSFKPLKPRQRSLVSPIKATIEPAAAKDDPEIALILLACGVGVATGAGVVIFNDAIHLIRDVIWEGEARIAARDILQQINEVEIWPKVVLPPVLGGIFVGILSVVLGGYDDKKTTNPGTTTTTSQSTNTTTTTSSSNSTDLWPSEELKERVLAVARPISRAIAAAVTLGTGASLGPEGPSVDIGRSSAKALGTLLRRQDLHINALIAAGSGAGVAAGFNAPIAGVFFAVETVLQKQMLKAAVSSALQQLQQESQSQSNESFSGSKKGKNTGGSSSSSSSVSSLVGTFTASSSASSGLTVAMVLLASVLAAVVSQAGLGSSPAFRVPEYRLESLYELPLYLVFGGLCGVVSASFSFSARVAGDAFDELKEGKSPITAALLPSIGGLTTGVLALGYPEILYQGFDNVNNILSSAGDYAPGLLIQIVVMKIIATSICRGSGLQGGIYAPSIFIGAALGSAFGEFAHAVGDPTGLLLSAPQAYALVGVAAMLASNCAVPLTSVLLLFELTRDYLIIVPTLGAVGISYWISQLAAPGVKSAATRRRTIALAAAAALTARDAVNAAANNNNSLSGSISGSGSDLTASCDVGGTGSTVEEITQNLTLSCATDTNCLLVPEDMAIADAVQLMSDQGQAVAVVLALEGGVLGLVTLERLKMQLEDALAYAEGAEGEGKESIGNDAAEVVGTKAAGEKET